MKFASYAEYDPKGIALSIPALLTVWAGIQRFSEDLVLVGGLVPHFICRHPESDTQPTLRGIVTLSRKRPTSPEGHGPETRGFILEAPCSPAGRVSL